MCIVAAQRAATRRARDMRHAAHLDQGLEQAFLNRHVTGANLEINTLSLFSADSFKRTVAKKAPTVVLGRQWSGLPGGGAEQSVRRQAAPPDTVFSW